MLTDDTRIGTQGFRKVQQEIKKTEAAIKQANAGLQTTGSAFSRAGNRAMAMGRQVLAALGFIGIILAIVNAMKQMVTTTIDFEYAMAEVKAITGATGAEFKRLEASALELGRTTRYTASEVAALQKEFAKLGFTTSEIIAASKATLNLATATGSDLASAADVAGSTLRGFGLEAANTQRVTDVMAKSFTSSALGMENFREAMKNVAPIAKVAGVDIETATAALGKLADAGIRGSRAGMALKNLLGKLADENSELSKKIGMSVRNSDDFVLALKKLSEQNIDLSEALEISDKRVAGAMLVLRDGASDVADFTRELYNATGATQEMADVMADNAQGDILKAKSAWEGLTLSLSNTTPIRFLIQIFGTELPIAITQFAERVKNWYKTGTFELPPKAVDEARKSGKAIGEEILLGMKQISSRSEKQMEFLVDNIIIETDRLNKELRNLKSLEDVGAPEEQLKMQRDEIARIRETLATIVPVYEAWKQKGVEATTEQIRNLLFLNSEIERVKKARLEANQTLERTAELNKELRALEDERNQLLGKLTQTEKDAAKAAEKAAKQAKEAEEARKKIIDGELEAKRTSIEKKAALDTIAALEEESLVQNLANAEIQIEITKIQELIALNKLYGLETYQLELELARKKKAIKDQEVKDHDAAEKEKTKNAEAEAEKQKQNTIKVAQAGIALVSDIGAAIFETQLRAYEQEQIELDRQLEQKLISEEAYKKRSAAIKKKAFQAEKDAQTFQAIMSTANAVLTALSSTPPPYGYILAGISAAMGAVQIAMIQSQPTPQFAKGTKDAPAGFKWVGEQGAELIYDQGGYPIITHAESNAIANDPYSDRAKAIRKKYDIPALDVGLFAPSMQLSDKAVRTARSTALDRKTGHYDALAEAIVFKLSTENSGIVHAIRSHQKTDRAGYAMLAKALRNNGDARTGW